MPRKMHKELCRGCGELYIPTGEGMLGFCEDPACQLQASGDEAVLALADVFYRWLDGSGDLLEEARQN